jgi:tripartite-type tricarboxylate transporter receptor subunit TctC
MTKGLAAVSKAFLSCLLALTSMAALQAQDFPNRPISLVVPFGPGGPTDIAARYLAKEGSALLPEQIIVLNKTGASATLGTTSVFRAEPDGYTILLADNISTVFQPRRMRLPYQGAGDFQPIIKIGDIPNVLVVRADSKWRTLAEFVADARAEPGKLRVSTAGKFTGTDLNLLEFNRIAGIDTLPVPATGGTGQSVNLLLGGFIEAIVAAPAAVVGQVQSNTMRPIAVFAKRRIALFPDVPTMSELGFETTMGVMIFISAPKSLGQAPLQKLHATFARAMNSQSFKSFADQHGYLVDPLGPEAIRKELNEWEQYFGKLAQQLDIHPTDQP